MILSKRQLPVLVERVVADTKAVQSQIAHEHELKVRQTHPILTCHVGCAHCCHHPFLIPIVEGVLLYRWLRAHGRWNAGLKQKILDTRDKTLGLNFGVWLLSNIACPLLDTQNKCMAYEARPLHCRVTFSSGPSEQCHPHMFGANLSQFIPNAEAIMEFNRKVQGGLKRAGIEGSLMPVSEALLLAEAIEAGDLPIENATFQHTKDMLRL
jgi:Fe-S-cluster containining protein